MDDQSEKRARGVLRVAKVNLKNSYEIFQMFKVSVRPLFTDGEALQFSRLATKLCELKKLTALVSDTCSLGSLVRGCFYAVGDIEQSINPDSRRSSLRDLQSATMSITNDSSAVDGEIQMLLQRPPPVKIEVEVEDRNEGPYDSLAKNPCHDRRFEVIVRQ